MRFMIIVKATDESEAEVTPVPSEELLQEMAAYHAELAAAGVLLDGSGLKPSSQGWRIAYDGDQRMLTDGPFDPGQDARGSAGVVAALPQPGWCWLASANRGAATLRVRRFWRAPGD
jgi:hypothetical protein